MTALPWGEVDANLLRGAALGGTQTRPDGQDAGGQDLGDLVEALGRGHQVRVESVGHEPCNPFMAHIVHLNSHTERANRYTL
jgi:hypothetical protein